ncbi:MAG: transcriptional repressor LexA [Deltaproteobacteria bacterium]|nr:transcriptional repressor LexA [Deltaproteobacteria bacterium]
MENLTKRQKEVLDFVTRCIDTLGAPPTLREISAHIGTRGTATALHHLQAIEKKGYLRRREGSSRGIALTEKTVRPEALISLPIVGTVSAGLPQPAVESIEGYCAISPEWVKGDGCFFLKVRGESMIEAHILDGDLALIRPQPTAENGEIVVALIDGAATLKRYYHEGDHIRLQPENRQMGPILIHENDAETIIVGKLLKTIRSHD